MTSPEADTIPCPPQKGTRDAMPPAERERAAIIAVGDHLSRARIELERAQQELRFLGEATFEIKAALDLVSEVQADMLERFGVR